MREMPSPQRWRDGIRLSRLFAQSSRARVVDRTSTGSLPTQRHAAGVDSAHSRHCFLVYLYRNPWLARKPMSAPGRWTECPPGLFLRVSRTLSHSLYRCLAFEQHTPRLLLLAPVLRTVAGSLLTSYKTQSNHALASGLVSAELRAGQIQICDFLKY